MNATKPTPTQFFRKLPQDTKMTYMVQPSFHDVLFIMTKEATIDTELDNKLRSVHYLETHMGNFFKVLKQMKMRATNEED